MKITLIILVALLSVSTVQANPTPEWELVTRKLNTNECAMFAEKRCENAFHLKPWAKEFKECKDQKTEECNERQKTKKED